MIKIAPTNKQKYFIEFIKSIEYFNSKYRGKSIIIHLQNNSYKSSEDINVIFNTEQLSIEYWQDKIFTSSISHPILDYSCENIKLLKDKNNNAICSVFPILFNPEIMNIKDCYENKNFEYDIVFVGCLTDRRNAILQNLIFKGYKVLIIHDNYDFQKKYDELFKAKILLNIHALENYKIFEFSRCSIPVYNSQIIISETSFDKFDSSNDSVLNQYILSKIIFSDYSEIEECVQNVLKNFDTYRYKVEIEQIKKLTEIEIENIKKFINRF